MPPQREWFEKDFYKVLGVPADAPAKEITRVYRKLAKQYHPDANPGSEERFKEISAAYEVLGDDARRKEYDEVRRLGPMGGAYGGRNAANGFSFRIDDLGDLFGGIFNRGTQRGAPNRPGTGPQRGRDQEAELHLSFEDAAQGVTTSVNVITEAVCSLCNGSGAAAGSAPTVCPTCGGRGVLDDNQGLFSFSQPCTRCHGKGVVIEKPCPRCHGNGMEEKPRRVKVRIPAGVADGQKIRVKGKGLPGRNNGPAGDLYVTVRVGSHSLFGRRGYDLTLTVPITFPEAALGTTITVPTLDKSVTVKIPSGTESGKTFRVRSRGIEKAGGARGDLLLTVEVQVPKNLTPAQKTAIEALGEATFDSPRANLGVS